MTRSIVLRVLLTVAAVCTVATPATANALSEAGSPAQVRSARNYVYLNADDYTVPRRGWVSLHAWTNTYRAGLRIVIWQKTVGGRLGWHREAVRFTNGRGYVHHNEDVNAGSRWYRACWGVTCSRAVFIRMV